MTAKPLEGCAASYLQAIEAKRKGIVLLYDQTADREVLKRKLKRAIACAATGPPLKLAT
jgi:hypothetical protein